MIEQQKQRIEQEMTKIIDEVERAYLRKAQVKMHHCAAKCCEDDRLSMDGVQRCVEQCTLPVNQMQNYIYSEVNKFQERLQRCVQLCNDDIRIQIPQSPTEAEVAKFTDKFERCAIGCVDKHVSYLPQMLKTMKSVLDKGPNYLRQD